MDVVCFIAAVQESLVFFYFCRIVSSLRACSPRYGGTGHLCNIVFVLIEDALVLLLSSLLHVDTPFGCTACGWARY